MDLELPPEMPNGLGGDDDDEEEDEDDDRDGLDDSYDLTGLSDKLHSIPTEALHEAPREVKIERGDAEIRLDEIGRPRGFDADAVLAKASPHAALPSTNGLKQPQEDIRMTSKVEENGVAAVEDTEQPCEEDSIAQSKAAKDLEESSADQSENATDFKQTSVTRSDVSSEVSQIISKETEDTSVENEAPQTVQEDVEERVDSDDSPQDQMQETISPGETKPTTQASVGRALEEDDDDDDFGDFDSAFAPTTNNVKSTSDIPTAFPAPSVSEPSSNWSASFVSSAPESSKAKEDDGEDDDFGDFGDFTNSSLVTATPSAEVADPDPSLESLQHILDSLRPKISFVISTFYQLAFMGAEEEGCQVSKLDLEAGVGDAGEEGNSENESGGDGVWNRVHRVDRSPGLSFGWDKSVANEKLLSNLKIDRNNIVFDSSFQSKRVGGGAGMASGGGSVPAFALGLSTTGLLEPTRVSDEHQVDAGKAPKGEISETGSSSSVPPAQFDWKDSGLTNPLSDEDLERQLDELGIPDTTVVSSGEDGISSGSGGVAAAVEAADSVSRDSTDWLPKKTSPPNSNMSSRSRATLDAFPLLDFMRSAALQMPKTPTPPPSSTSPVPGPNLLA